jgi:hypothetical protein
MSRSYNGLLFAVIVRRRYFSTPISCDDACRLIRQSNGSDVEMATGERPGDPRTRNPVAANPMHGGTGAVHQQFTKIGVASLAYPTEPFFATRRILFRDQAYPAAKS